MTSPTLHVPQLDRSEHSALIALSKGEADQYQQVLALQVIVKKFAQPQDLLFVAGSPDETAFLNGRAFVASRVRMYLSKSVSETQENENVTQT